MQEEREVAIVRSVYHMDENRFAADIIIPEKGLPFGDRC